MKKSNTHLGRSSICFGGRQPLGIEEPEVLTVLLDQDPVAKKQYDQLPMEKNVVLSLDCSRQKTLIQVQKILGFLEEQAIRKG